MFVLNFIGALIGIVLGGYILFAGRHAIWATLGIVSLAAAADLLAVLVAGLDSGRDLITAQAWGLLGIAVIVMVLGILLGRAKPETAVLVIGFIAGADVALWLYAISAYVMTTVAQQSAQTAMVVGVVVLVVGGLLGLWLVRQMREEALILITMLVGARLLQNALGLSSTSSWTAVIVITLALAGVLVQYALYLRDLKAEEIMPEVHASSMAYFQDLELDL